MKKITAVFLIFLIFAAAPLSTYAQEDLTEVINGTAEFLKQSVPAPCVSAVGGEWTVLALAQSGRGDAEYFDRYYNALCQYVREKNGVLHSRKYTEYARVVITLTAIGKNPANVEGYNLLAPLADFDSCVKQGINGAVWALIALDSKNYGDVQTRDRYIEYILERQRGDGGWALSQVEEGIDSDVTAMALTALAKYRGRDDVQTAIERGVEALSRIQLVSGGFENGGVQNSESTAQVLVAISTLGISIDDPRFVKGEKHIIDSLLSYRDNQGGFKHTDSVNIMATEQCLYSLVAADRMAKGKSPLFDMNERADREIIPETVKLVAKLHMICVQKYLSQRGE